MRCSNLRTWPLAALSASLLTAATVAPGVSAQGTPIGFEEEFGLAPDRAAALAQLIPGTDEHFYYACLLAQHQQRFADVPPLLERWTHEHGRSQRVVEIENRQALLTFERSPAATWSFLRTRLGLNFDHQRQVPGAAPDVPTRLDPELLSPARLTRRAFELHDNSLAGFRDSALRALATTNLSAGQLHLLLRRLDHPDVPNLAALVVRDLGSTYTGQFGAIPIHNALLLGQLEEVWRLRPATANDASFVDVYVKRLLPSDDVDWPTDVEARGAYLERLNAFAQRLPAVHNSFKAHVLYHLLAHDLAVGTPDEERLLAYLRLPRRVGYVLPRHLEISNRRGEPIADITRAFPTGLAAIGDDEALVRSYLEHFFVSAGSFERYAEYLRADWVRRVFAETKILAGVGDVQQWYALLDSPAWFEQLRDRVEILFPATSDVQVGVDEPVSLAVDVKNVDKLLIKVFEIHTFNFLRNEAKEVDASIDLDGLVANEERTLDLDANPLRRVRHRIEFPSIDHRGVFVVELIGNGISSRAIVRKGHLQLVEEPGAAGHVMRVLDEAGRHLQDATIWFGGREYSSDDAGEIVVPYSTEPASKPVILRHGGFAMLKHFWHAAEAYDLQAGIHVAREALLPGNRAKLLIRPSLRLNGRPIGIEFLEEPVLTIVAVDADGIESRQDIRGIQLSDGGETVHEITVPADLWSLKVSLSGRTRSLTRNEPVSLASDVVEFPVDRIEATPMTSCLLLGRTPSGYVLDQLGKDGEPKADRAVRLTLRHRDYTDDIEVLLKTDERGRIELGALPGIEAVHAGGFPGEIGSWRLRDAAGTLPAALQGTADQVLRVPYLGEATAVDRRIAALIELRDGVYARDAFDRLTLEGGYVVIRGLTPGDYELWLKEPDTRIAVRITDGDRHDGWAIGRDRALELADGSVLHVTDVATAEGELRVTLANASAATRVHVSASRFLEPFDPFDDLRLSGAAPPLATALADALTSYHAGREIGDEYRYILERRFATKFPGNMLQRPSLLLNPWVLEETVTHIGIQGGAGGRFGGRGGAGGATPAARSVGTDRGSGVPPGAFPDLQFLPAPAHTVANLRPGDDGIVRVPLADLGDGQILHVVAVDGATTVYRTSLRDEKPLTSETRRLRRALDPDRHFAQHREIDFVQQGGNAVIDDAQSAELETFDSLAAVHQLFQTLTGNSDLAKFEFVVRWPSLTPEEKRTLYSEHACHELHFFLHQKDREFFDAVVRPYLANKLHKTFLDRWLLEDDLVEFLDPWAFARLNVVERVLLARRIEGQSASVARQIRELVDLIPPDPQAEGRLLRKALKSDALAMSAGVQERLADLKRELEVAEVAQMPAEPVPDRAVENLRTQAPKAAGAVPGPAGPATPGPATGVAGQFFMGRDQGEVDRRRRDDARELYRIVDPTQRLAEQNYWQRPIEQQDGDLVTANRFWSAFAQADPGAPFVSPAVVQATRNFTEMMLALAVLDLPFDAAQHTSAVDGRVLTLTARSPLLLVREEIAPAADADPDAAPILVSQNVYRLDTPFTFDGNQQRDAYLSDELLVDVAYGCRVVVTNPTSSSREVELLLQIPAGAVPVQRGFTTRGVPLRLEGYATRTVEYAFYFPRPGTAPHYPVNVSQDGRFLAAAEPVVWNVVTEPTRVDTTSWQHVSQNAEPAEVLQFLQDANLYRLDLDLVAWRMRERDFFEAAIALLGRRHVYNDLLWSYGIHHQDIDVADDYLRHQEQFLAQCGPYLRSPLVTIDAVERRWYQHIEYAPLLNQRAHRFGGQHRIQNDSFAQQYSALMSVLCHVPALDSEDWLSATYYLLLQDRVAEALAAFARVDAEQLPTRLQHDYMRSYLGFYTGEHALARQIAERHRDHPVTRWRGMFREVLAQLDEAAGQAVAGGDEDDRTRRQTTLAASEPSLELQVESRRITLQYDNLQQCRVNYFVMDVEFLFSTHPFVQQGSGAFAYVRPNHSAVLDLPADRRQIAFDLPEALHNANVLVEVTAGGVTRRAAYYANSLAVRWIDTYGQLQVSRADGAAPLPQVYVKVFARLPSGQVRFHKDGYTDLRGRFDYASVSGPDAAGADRFAVLVLSEDHGAVIRELEPPTR